ncbi:unnamed protein product [Eruca vesicaria subsp. sativa]|uniref:Transcription initiation factor IIA gamma subunit N-terminal domain-containing protein n=1 Tax=Eruca vesicaria subsp. sativa TaxID=29727 RepID=A0ABC8KWZ8_ERUVS|nr:unnamed protein product [Eruca vesicaria subsp. sativa]
MATFDLYRRSMIGMCLTETLDEMVQSGTLSPELAIQVLVQFDKSMTEALESQVKTKVSIKQPSRINNPPPTLCSSTHRSAKNRIGHALRSSWGRRESDHKCQRKAILWQ